MSALRQNDVVRVSWRTEGMEQYRGKLARVKGPYLHTGSWELVLGSGEEIIVPLVYLDVLYRAPRPGQMVRVQRDAPAEALLVGKEAAAVRPSATRVDHWVVSTPMYTGIVHIGFLDFDPEAGWTETTNDSIQMGGTETEATEQMIPASRVIEVAMKYARKHDWCDVIRDDVFPELGLEYPKPRKIRFVIEVDEEDYFEDVEDHDTADFENWDVDVKLENLADTIDVMSLHEKINAYVSAEFVDKE